MVRSPVVPMSLEATHRGTRTSKLRGVQAEEFSRPGAEKRRRGRPKAGSRRADARAGILRAAADEFAQHGYDGASVRAIARRASVDPSLVYHYFADKADLFAAIIDAPIRPDRMIETILAGPRDEVGENVVRFLLDQLGDPKVRKRAVAMIRTVFGQAAGSGLLREFLVREVFLRLAHGIRTPDAELRAALAASQVIGFITVRFVLELDPVAKADVDELVARVAPVIQWHLVGYGSRAAPGDAG
jgi:AcrR family transcriptional regulator